METEINQYLAVQRGLAEEQRQDRRERNRDRDRRNRDRGRRNRFSDREDRDREDRDRDRDYNNRDNNNRDNGNRDNGNRDNRENNRDNRDRDRDRDWDSSPRDRSDRDAYGRNDRHPGDRGRRGRSSIERPSRTIMLKNCHNSIDDSDIRTVLQLFGAPIKDVRLVKHRDTEEQGVSRGFAFVEFQFLPDAQRWMEENQGRVQIAGHWAQMVYSANREREEDWFCSQCGTHNFKRREYCFKCSIPKEESERYSEISSIPTTTLLLMGLDALTTEETVSRSLNDISAVDMNIRIARDALTNTSRGLCYVDFASLELSSHILDILCNKMPSTFSIDGNNISVHYCKSPQQQPVSSPPGIATGANAVPVAAVSTNVASTAIAAAQWSTTADKQAHLAAAQEAALQQQPVQFDNAYYTQQYGVAQQEIIAQQQQQYSSHQFPAPFQGQSEAVTESDASSKMKASSKSGKRSSADIVGAPVIKQDATKGEEKVSKLGQAEAGQDNNGAQEYQSVTVDGVEYPVYPPPDVEQYSYDEESGYYLDPTTALYYDSTSQYYYNSVTQAYMYWDSSKSTYLPAPLSAALESQAPPKSIELSDGTEIGLPEGKKEIKNKVAKKVAKDMARWAKSMNIAKLSASKKAQMAAAAALAANRNAGAADAGFSMLMKRADPKETKTTVMNVLKRQTDVDTSAIVASYGGGSDSDDDQDQNNSSRLTGNQELAEQPLTDWKKLICLLCKRQFPSREVLVKHQQFSDLHKQNLEVLQSRTGQTDQEIKYRDRAKERRDKYGTPDPPATKKKYKHQVQAPVPYEEPTKGGIGEDNIGNKMLKAMGWNESGGLGKKRQGRRDPIEVSRRQKGAGLGLKGAGYVADGDTYKDNVKKMTQYRYQELF